MKGWVNMTEKAKRRRYIVSAVSQVLAGLIASGAFVCISLLGEWICKLCGVGA